MSLFPAPRNIPPPTQGWTWISTLSGNRVMTFSEHPSQDVGVHPHWTSSEPDLISWHLPSPEECQGQGIGAHPPLQVEGNSFRSWSGIRCLQPGTRGWTRGSVAQERVGAGGADLRLRRCLARGAGDLGTSPARSAFSQPRVLGFVGCRESHKTDRALAGSLGRPRLLGPSPHSPEVARKVGSWRFLSH